MAEALGKPVKFVPETRGAELEAAIAELKDGEILMFENTRFEDIVFRFYEDRNLRLYKRDMRILKQIGFKDIENVKNLKI